MAFHNFMFSGPHETTITGHGVWSHEAQVVIEDVSHLKLITMGLLQTCSYVAEQMPTPVTINVNNFMESFSIKAEGGEICPLPVTGGILPIHDDC